MAKKDYHLTKDPIKGENYLAELTPWILIQGKKIIEKTFRKTRRFIRHAYESASRSSLSYKEAERTAQGRQADYLELGRQNAVLLHETRTIEQTLASAQKEARAVLLKLQDREARLEQSKAELHNASLESIKYMETAYLDGLRIGKSDNPLIVTDDMGNILYQSQSLNSLGLGALVGKRLEEIIHGETPEEAIAAAEDILHDSTLKPGLVYLKQPGKQKGLLTEVQMVQQRTMNIETGLQVNYATTINVLNYGVKLKLKEVMRRGARIFQKSLVKHADEAERELGSQQTEQPQSP